MLRIPASIIAMSVLGCGGVSAPRTDEPDITPRVVATGGAGGLAPTTGATCDDSGWCRFAALTPSEWAEEIRLAPDGGLWLIGDARVVRWADGAFALWWLDVHLVDLSTAGTRTWVVGADGYAAYRDDGDWQRVETGVSDWVVSVSGLPDGTAYAVAKGQLLRLTPQGVNATAGPEPGEARDVSATAADDVWVIGDDVWHWDGGSWAALPDPVGSDDAWWVAIHAVGPRDVWAIRASGAYHWDGTRWRAHALALSPSSRLHAAGGLLQISEDDTTHVWDGGRWVAHHTPFERAILTSDGDTIGADYDAFTAHGTTVTRAPRGVGIAAHSLWAGDDAVWIGGAVWDEHEGRNHAAAARWDGERWQVWHLDGKRIQRINGHGREVWMLTDDGIAHGWDGDGWIHEATGLRRAGAIAVAGPGDVWATDGKRLVRRSDDGWRTLSTLGVSAIEGLDVGLDGVLVAAVRRTGWPLIQQILAWNGDTWELVDERRQAPHAIVALSDGAVISADSDELSPHTGGYPFHVWDVAAGDGQLVILGTTEDDERAHVLTVVNGEVTRVRLPAAQLERITIAPDGSVWAIQVPGGDVWFRPR